MAEGPYDVFISYRRESGSAEARLIREELQRRGKRVFLDMNDLKRGYFDEALLRYIAGAPNFIVILSPKSLDRCNDRDDWMRQEIAHAVKTERNIIPVMLPGFVFPPALDPSIKTLPRHQGVEYSHTFFVAMIQRIVEGLHAPDEPPTLGIGALPEVEQQQRVLEAAAPKQSAVGRSTEVVTMVRRTDSAGLRGYLDEEKIPSLSCKNVRERPFELDFPLDASGKPQPAEIALRLDSPDFEPRSQAKKLKVPPRGDSEPYTFLIIPRVAGELVVNLELLKGDEVVVSRAIRMRAEPEGVTAGRSPILAWAQAGRTIVTIPLVVVVHESGGTVATRERETTATGLDLEPALAGPPPLQMSRGAPSPAVYRMAGKPQARRSIGRLLAISVPAVLVIGASVAFWQIRRPAARYSPAPPLGSPPAVIQNPRGVGPGAATNLFDVPTTWQVSGTYNGAPVAWVLHTYTNSSIRVTVGEALIGNGGWRYDAAKQTLDVKGTNLVLSVPFRCVFLVNGVEPDSLTGECSDSLGTRYGVVATRQ